MAPKLILVTGASSGIGAATAKRYGAHGAHVVLLARNAERLYKVAHAIREAGGGATAFPLDLAGTEATRDVVGRIETDIGTPDVVINNAGAGRWRPLIETSADEARDMMDVPYLAAFGISRAVVPGMVARGSGNLAFVTSPASYLAWPNASAYIAARRALAGFAESLQMELKPTGIAVTIVVLGAVDTPYFEHNPGTLENMPHADPRLLPTLSEDDAASAIVGGVAKNKRFVVKPALYRALFVMNALFPKTMASQMRRASKKAKAKNV